MKKWSKRLSGIIFVAVLTLMFCGCEKNETGVPYGVYTSEYGTIRFENNKIYFENMDEELIIDRITARAGMSAYVDGMSDGEGITLGELISVEEDAEENFDASKYANKEYSFKYTKYDEYDCVLFMLYDGEEYMYNVEYYTEEQYMLFSLKEFRVE